MSIDEEINDIEKNIKTLEMNDNYNNAVSEMIKDGESKGLIYDFLNVNKQYRGTIYSSKVIKKDDYNDFQKYIDKCEKEEYDKYTKWKEDIISSGVEYSKDELKYIKMI